jgi:glycosidase
MSQPVGATVLFVVSTLLLGCAGGEEPTGSPIGGSGGAGGGGGSGGSGGTGGSEPAGFVAHYHTPWSAPHIHFAIQGEWTVVPGKPMLPEAGGWYTYEHDAWGGSLEFVFNDGGELWDNNDEKNYRTELREFWVKGGEIFAAKPGDQPGLFCSGVDCGQGVCNESAARCDCDAGYRYDGALRTCVVDACANVDCGNGVCDPVTGKCVESCVPDRLVGDFRFCTWKSDSSYAVVVEYQGSGTIDLGASEVRLNGASVDLSGAFDAATQTFRVAATGVEPSKYSYLFRLKQQGGQDVRPLFIPFWMGAGVRYGDFVWKDAILYQIMTDRFHNGDPSNDIDNTAGSLAEVTDVRSQWQGGDFRGIIDKIEGGYFESMGMNALWISSPVLNSHNAQTAVDPGDSRKFSSYHAYHPIATGYTHLNDYGYANPVESAFGTASELHELVNKAHGRGIRVIPDFVANHVQLEAKIYQDHKDWFHPYVQCHDNWDAHRLDCWFTTTTPDFNFSIPAARKAVIDHAIWMIQEFNFDGFRADALKHMQDEFVRELKAAVKEQVETTVDNHDVSEEPTIFYMVGESLGGGWPRYHVRADMVQGQVDEEYYNHAKGALLTFQRSVRNLAEFSIPNDTAFLTPQPTHGSAGGYPGAVMGNFFGNHDQWRALTEAGGDHRRLRLAQTFLMTSPGNIPMLYQGDDIGMFGEQDPDNRKMMVFSGLTQDQQASLENVRRLGKAREAHPALRRGSRQTVVLEDWFWVYKVTHQGDEVYVAINRDDNKSYAPPAGYVDVLGNCSGGVVPILSSCVFVK